MDARILNLIIKYNNSCIPDNHGAISDLMSHVGEVFQYNDSPHTLKVIPITGVHNVQLFKFFITPT
jgi:hypothetical protein